MRRSARRVPSQSCACDLPVIGFQWPRGGDAKTKPHWAPWAMALRGKAPCEIAVRVKSSRAGGPMAGFLFSGRELRARDPCPVRAVQLAVAQLGFDDARVGQRMAQAEIRGHVRRERRDQQSERAGV